MLNKIIKDNNPIDLLIAINIGLYIFIFYVNSLTINDGVFITLKMVDQTGLEPITQELFPTYTF